MEALSHLEVLIIDCQATAAAPRGHLLEVGWARAGTSITPAEARLVALPPGERIPPAVARITGVSDRMMRGAIDAGAAWRALAEAAASLTPQPAPTIIHFKRFEEPFLDRLAGGAPPLDVVCTHEIARRLLPDLPRRSLRALAGYFGRAVGPLRRSGDHVEATTFVWRELVRLLEAEDVATWDELKAWLAWPVGSTRRRRRVWPMPRDIRLALPDAPGIYRMLRTSGDVLYVGKAASLHHRVNSYFRHQRGVGERMLEMLSQARGISYEVSPTALEAALAEPDEIKRCRPPYNIALIDGERRVYFASADLTEHGPRPTRRCRVGPFGSSEMLEQFAAFVRGDPTSLGRGRWAPDAPTFDLGYARLCAAHGELSEGRGEMSARALRLGTRLWREGRRDRDADADTPASDRPVAVWTPESVQLALEWLAVRAAHARRRAGWFTRLAEASIVWAEPGAGPSRLLVLQNGDIAIRADVDAGAEPPIPPGHLRPIAARHEAFTVARFDRLRVLATELKRLAGAGAPLAVRLGSSPALAGVRLASLLAWV